MNAPDPVEPSAASAITGGPVPPPTATPRRLLVGVGSPHGLDQIGWQVADRLRETLAGGWQVRRAIVPLDLLDWLADVDELHVVDASLDLSIDQPLFHMTWPDPRIAMGTSRATHDFDLGRALGLAESLGCLPSHVSVWVIPVGHVACSPAGRRTAERGPESGEWNPSTDAVGDWAETLRAAIQSSWFDPPDLRDSPSEAADPDA